VFLVVNVVTEAAPSCARLNVGLGNRRDQTHIRTSANLLHFTAIVAGCILHELAGIGLSSGSPHGTPQL
jgi:hypothetical protein